MKLIIAVAAAGIVSSLTVITPAQAQKDPACVEKCNRENKVDGHRDVPRPVVARGALDIVMGEVQGAHSGFTEITWGHT